jgi:hypothetical protein
MIPYRNSNRVTLSADAPERVQGPRHRHGKPPNPEQGPITFAHFNQSCDPMTVEGADPASWRLSLLRYKVRDKFGGKLSTPRLDTAPNWVNLKLHAQGKAYHKANFWIAWNVADRRINRRCDTTALGQLRPTLYAAVTALLAHAGDELLEPALLPLWQVGCVRDELLIEEDAIYGQLKTLLIGGKTMVPESELPTIKAYVPLLAEHGKRYRASALDGVMAGMLEVTRTA